MDIKKIFITGAGGAGTIQVIRRLKNNGRFYVVAGDSEPYAYGLKKADKAYVLPLAVTDNYIDFVHKILVDERIEYYIPTIDEEILKAFTLKKGFKNLKILLPHEEFCELVLDKCALISKLAKYNFPSPKTFLIKEFNSQLSYPVFVKPRRGRGSRNARLINSKEELHAFQILSGLRDDELMVQQYLDGQEYTVSVVVNSVNSLFAIVPKKVLIKKGITLLAETERVEEIETLCRDIVNKLKPCGPFNVQLKFVNGVPCVFEINPRYSTTVALTLEAGIDEVGILLDRYDEIYNAGLLPFKDKVVLSRHWESVFYEK